MFGATLRINASFNKNFNKRGNNDTQIGDRRRSRYDSYRENLRQYLMNTTLHGLKYVGDKKISRLEQWVIQK